jgi:hypothetical protein
MRDIYGTGPSYEMAVADALDTWKGQDANYRKRSFKLRVVKHEIDYDFYGTTHKVYVEEVT